MSIVNVPTVVSVALTDNAYHAITAAGTNKGDGILVTAPVAIALMLSFDGGAHDHQYIPANTSFTMPKEVGMDLGWSVKKAVEGSANATVSCTIYL